MCLKVNLQQQAISDVVPLPETEFLLLRRGSCTVGMSLSSNTPQLTPGLPCTNGNLPLIELRTLVN